MQRSEAHRNSHIFREANAQGAALLHFPTTLTAWASCSSSSLVSCRADENLLELCPAWVPAEGGSVGREHELRCSALRNPHSCVHPSVARSPRPAARAEMDSWHDPRWTRSAPPNSVPIPNRYQFVAPACQVRKTSYQIPARYICELTSRVPPSRC